jgi:hypothetical protein
VLFQYEPWLKLVVQLGKKMDSKVNMFFLSYLVLHKRVKPCLLFSDFVLSRRSFHRFSDRDLDPC